MKQTVSRLVRAASFIAAIAAGPLVLGSGTAAANMICGAHNDIRSALTGNYKEVRAGLGLAGDGTVVELYVAETGSWTMLVTKPAGVSCVVASGDNWEIVKPIFATSSDAEL